MATLHALVVDDSAAMRRQLCQLLQRMGVDAVEACDGADAWRKLAATTFDVVLTDINMPILDGLKLVALIRSGGANLRVPIVVITTESAEADRARAMGLGANAYLVKPVQATRVMEALKQVLRMG